MSGSVYQNGVLVVCDRCTPFVRESLKESLILPRFLGTEGNCICDVYCYYHIEVSSSINNLMVKSKGLTLKFTNDSRRKLLKTLKESQQK